jgi:two-component system, OmpR family, phosphate regulon sensor histidine kinase PhoR
MMKKKYSAEWYEEVLNSVSELLFVKGKKSKLLWANKAFCDYYGMTPEQLKNIIDAPSSDPDDTVQYVKDDNYVYTKGIRLNIPAEPVTDFKGNLAYFHTIKSPVFDTKGNVYQTVGVARLINDEKLIKDSENIRNENKNTINDFKTLVQNSPLSVAMLDNSDRFINYSELWLKVFKKDVDKNYIGDFYDPKFEKILQLSEYIKSAKQGNMQKLKAVFFNDMYFDIQIKPWALATGEIGGTLIIAHDITDLKNNEEQLKQLNDELSQFNYRVSHDLVAPLKSVKGLLNIAELELEDGNIDTVKELHEDISKSIDHFSSLIEDVINLSRTDIIEQTNDEICFSEIIELITQKYQTDIKNFKITINTNIVIDKLTSSRVRIQQILENLISNAIKYYDEDNGESFINISVLEKDDSIKVAIEDNGIGFEAESISTIFDIFTRANSKTTGSGLGLYIVKKHLNVLNGTIAITNLKNNTIIEFEIPKRVLNDKN